VKYVFCLVLASCSLPITNGTPAETGSAAEPTAPDAAAAHVPSPFDLATMATVMTYKSRAFEPVNKISYASTVGTFEINVYITGDAGTYWRIHPETEATAPLTVGVGTVIVREVLDPQGAVSSITAIAKAPAGFDPTLDDWWFAEADPSGTPQQIGAVSACHSCHVPRAADDYLFGVPRTDQARRLF